MHSQGLGDGWAHLELKMSYWVPKYGTRLGASSWEEFEGKAPRILIFPGPKIRIR